MSDFIEKLSSFFENFPGIGPRQAKRFVYYLIDEDEKYLEELADLIKKTKDIKRCSLCFQTIEEKNPHKKSDICGICADSKRDQSTLIIVEKDLDFANIERTRNYNGLYFILGGAVSPLRTEFNKKLRLKELFLRIKNDQKIKEVIAATSTGPEGEMTSRYIQKILEPLHQKQQFKISRIARGLHTGADLEYLDGETIKNAIENRK